MVSITSALRYVTSAPRYQSRSSMYIRGLILWNSTKLADAVPIGMTYITECNCCHQFMRSNNNSVDLDSTSQSTRNNKRYKMNACFVETAHALVVSIIFFITRRKGSLTAVYCNCSPNASRFTYIFFSADHLKNNFFKNSFWNTIRAGL